MAALPDLTVSATQAARAYQRVEQGSVAPAGAGEEAPDFGAVLGQALAGVVAAGRSAETHSMAALAGGGDVTAAVTALSRADLALQTTLALRDRVVQAYQDIMKMPI